MLKSSQFNTILRVSKQRYLCKNCKKSFSINLKLVEPNCSIANDVKLAIKLELKECRALKYIAKQFDVSASTVNRIINDLPNYKPNFNYLPESLCFDEFKSTKDADGAMSFIYCDAENSKIIDIVEEGTIKIALKTFKKYFKYIENSLSSIYSNGRIEGVIRRIKVFKNIAYGYRSFFNFKKRILISANIKKIVPENFWNYLKIYFIFYQHHLT